MTTVSGSSGDRRQWLHTWQKGRQRLHAQQMQQWSKHLAQQTQLEWQQSQRLAAQLIPRRLAHQEYLPGGGHDQLC